MVSKRRDGGNHHGGVYRGGQVSGPMSRACPKCGSGIGRRCTRTTGSGLIQEMATVHPERKD